MKKYESDKTCECGEQYGNHRWEDDACPRSLKDGTWLSRTFTPRVEPIPAGEEQESQEELWKCAITLYAIHGVKRVALQELQKHFTLTRKPS